MKEIITEKDVKHAISNYLIYETDQYATRQNIVLIKIISIVHDVVLILIVTKRPGLLIGKKGTNIDALKASVKRQLDIPHLSINLSEFDTFIQDNEQLAKHFKNTVHGATETKLSALVQQGTPGYGLCPPPLDAQKGLNILIEHLLGKDWYVVMPVGVEQSNTEAVYAILNKYSKKRRSLRELAKSLWCSLRDWCEYINHKKRQRI